MVTPVAPDRFGPTCFCRGRLWLSCSTKDRVELSAPSVAVDGGTVVSGALRITVRRPSRPELVPSPRHFFASPAAVTLGDSSAVFGQHPFQVRKRPYPGNRDLASGHRVFLGATRCAWFHTAQKPDKALDVSLLPCCACTLRKALHAILLCSFAHFTNQYHVWHSVD